MSVLLPELIDVGEAVTLRAVLLALGSLLLWIGAVLFAALALAIASMILWPLNQFVRTITFGTVGSVPGSHAVEQFLTNAVGSAAKGVDGAAGSFWHGLKHLVVSVGEELFGLAILAGYIYWWAYTKLPLIIWHRFGRAIHAGQREATATARAAEKAALRAERFTRSEVRHINHRIGAIDHTIDSVLTPELKSARELAKEAENLASNAWDYIQSKKFTNWIEGLVAAAVTAAGVLAFDFLKCAEWRRLGSSLTCGMGQFLLDLLEGAIAIMVIEDICAITKAAIDVIESSEVSDFLTHVEDGMQDLFTCQNVDLAAPLSGPYYTPPDVQPYAVLA